MKFNPRYLTPNGSGLYINAGDGICQYCGSADDCHDVDCPNQNNCARCGEVVHGCDCKGGAYEEWDPETDTAVRFQRECDYPECYCTQSCNCRGQS